LRWTIGNLRTRRLFPCSTRWGSGARRDIICSLVAPGVARRNVVCKFPRGRSQVGHRGKSVDRSLPSCVWMHGMLVLLAPSFLKWIIRGLDHLRNSSTRTRLFARFASTVTFEGLGRNFDHGRCAVFLLNTGPTQIRGYMCQGWRHGFERLCIGI